MGRVLVDDLDNTVHDPDNGKEVLNWNFGFGPANAMKTYSIDLTAENFAKIEKALDDFVKVANEVDSPNRASVRSSAPRRTSSPAPAKGGPSRAAQIREWAAGDPQWKDKVAARGRIHKDVEEAYDYAMESDKKGDPKS